MTSLLIQTLPLRSRMLRENMDGASYFLSFDLDKKMRYPLNLSTARCGQQGPQGRPGTVGGSETRAPALGSGAVSMEGAR